MRVVFFALLLARALAFTCDHSAYKELNLEQGAANLIHTTRILYPTTPGSYSVLTWFHGFMLTLQTYDQILCEAAKSHIVICLQMKERLLSEGLDADAKLIKPYLYDDAKGILPRIGSSSILPGYSYTQVALGGHSRGGGVIAYAYSHGIVADGDFSSVAFVDPVVLQDKDVSKSVSLTKTKVRTLFFNDPQSLCVTKGWPQFGDKFAGCSDLKVTNATECKHMDVLSSWGSILPICHGDANEIATCMALARNVIAAAVSDMSPASLVV
jgi:hypothetical protein